MYTDNPIADFDYYDYQETKKLMKLPVCAECGKPIQTDECYEINGELICPDCLNDNYRKWTDEFIEE